MREELEIIRGRLDEICNVCGPFELQLTDLQEQVSEIRASVKQCGSTSSTNSFAARDLERRSQDLLERIIRIERALQISPKMAGASPSPVRKDKRNREIPPPLKPWVWLEKIWVRKSAMSEHE